MCAALVWRIRSRFSARTHRISFAACTFAFAAALHFFRSQELNRYERWLWAVECVKVRGQAPSEIQAVSFSVSASHSSLDCAQYVSYRLHVPRGRPPSDGVKRLTLVPRENVGHDEKERKMQRKRERALETLSAFVVVLLLPAPLTIAFHLQTQSTTLKLLARACWIPTPT